MNIYEYLEIINVTNYNVFYIQCISMFHMVKIYDIFT